MKFKIHSIVITVMVIVAAHLNASEKTFLYSPDIQLISFTLKTVDNKSIPIDTLLNKGPVLIVFWALWCNPCKDELQALNRLKSEHPFDKISIVAINIDSPRGLARVRGYVSTHPYPFLYCLDPNQDILHLLNSWAIPYTVLISVQRKIVLKHTGYLSGDERVLQKEIELHFQKKK